MSEQSKTLTGEKSARTARAVAAILSQTATDELLRELNQTDGRNQSEQASFLAEQSPFLREIYERGGTIVDGVLSVPKENLIVSPEIEIATTHAAVARLTRITGNPVKAKEIAPQFVEMGERIAGSQSDGETRLKVFGWLYRVLEGKQELLNTEARETDALNSQIQPEGQFAEKWQQIVELSEALAALEPNDRLPENSLESLNENQFETDNERNEDLMTAESYENALEAENAERADQFVPSGNLIGFERIEIGSDLPKIPENLSRGDFEKLLEKAGEIDFQIEQGIPTREILAPFERYVELTRLDNELRLIEEEFVKTQKIENNENQSQNYRFIATREELREFSEDRQTLDALLGEQIKIKEIIKNDFDDPVDREKVERLVSARIFDSGVKNQVDSASTDKIELTEDEVELSRFLTREKSVGREIVALSEQIAAREKDFRPFDDLSLLQKEIPATRRKELFEQVQSLELPVSSILKEKYPELTAEKRNEKLKAANTFEIKSPAEYLFVREAANNQFQILRNREIKNEYRKAGAQNGGEITDAKKARRETDSHQEKIKTLKQLKPNFAFKIEGSNRVINAVPSERAAAGYDFASEYVRYQLKQPEIRARRESAVYREYAERLESAKTSQEVVREAYKIRQENHRAAGLWKNAPKEEQNKLQRPLSKNEMTLLFLELPPKNYTAEMSFIKYNFAHYSQAKEQMTAALEKGNLEPSAEAQKLARSLEGRLDRRDLETKRKATRHFFESLKTENEKLFLKNEFDHKGAYQNLPPHEKDWIYARAQEQKENLEYKIAFEHEKNTPAKLQTQSEAVVTNQSTKNLRQEFAVGTLWYQARTLANQKETKNFESGAANVDENLAKTIGFLIHNQSEANNLRVSDWLEQQKSEELQMSGEILKTFARATREIENNKLTVTIKIAETNRVSTADYKNLFERYFPADFEKIKEFRVNDSQKFRFEHSRRNGQSTLLDAWKQDANSEIYQPNAPIKVFENERKELQAIESIKAAQVKCRRSVEVKNTILLKYEENLKKEFAKTGQAVSEGDLRTAVERALAPEKSAALSNDQKTIFQKAQDKISSSDFERFLENTKLIEKGIIEINQSFEAIAELRLENAQYKFAPEKAIKQDSLQKQYDTIQQLAQAEQSTAIAREKFNANNTYDFNTAQTTLIDHVSDEQREKARVESYKQARIALEPAQLSESDQSRETQSKALEFADALEEAHQASLNKKSESEIEQAFAIAETKRQRLDETLQIEKQSNFLPENKPVSLTIYERELERNEKAIAQAKISNMIEAGELSLRDLETKKAGEIFTAKERDEIRIEAGERTRENLEPKELWARRSDVSENLQQAALHASEALEKAHGIYHETGADKKEIARTFSALDAGIIKLKNERQTNKIAAKFINFKTDFKHDLAQMFERGQPSENPQLLAAMTKGLLINSLEKQNLASEKIGISSEKLSEISRTITLAMVEDKKREKAVAIVNNQSVELSVLDSRTAQSKISAEKSSVPVKTRLFEHMR
ncbi:MAG: hypothetical protein WA584_02230 [Pyrinomonadaceae bacterium]